MMSRRSLLAGLGAPLAAPVAACARPAGRVLVIGAGMAGLAAAAALRAADVSVTVLEARLRTGGRIHTSTAWPDLPVDLGASWIHGVTGNPVTRLAAEAGARTVTTSHDSARLTIDAGLAALGARDAGEARSRALLDRALAWARDRAPDRDVSVAQALAAVVRPGPPDPVAQAQLDYLVTSTLEQEYGAPARTLSARTGDDGDSYPGADALFPLGYGQLAGHLARGLDVRLGAVVRAVRVRNAGVSVELASGAVLEAGQVLVTVPLGVLKAGTIRFDPPLADAQAAAVERIGMGLLNKLVLRFDRLFWPAGTDWHTHLAPAATGWSEWVSLARPTGVPVLMAFTAADHADAVEALVDREIVSQAMARARDMFGARIPDPVASQISRWLADPLARGAYSYNAVGTTRADRRALAAPLAGRVHFAGEATSAGHHGTVHGALETGRAAAARILASTA